MALFYVAVRVYIHTCFMCYRVTTIYNNNEINILDTSKG